MSQVSIDILPEDVWPAIVGFMDDKSKRQMRLANTKWFNYIKYNKFTLYFTKYEQLPAITERLSKYSWPIELTFDKIQITDMQNVTKYLCKLTNLTKMHENKYANNCISSNADHWMQLTTLTNIENWRFQFDKLPLELWKHFTKITNWTVMGHRTEEVAPILKRMVNLEWLFYNCNSVAPPFVYLSHPEKLTSLRMFLKNGMEDYKQEWSKLTNLKDLTCLGNSGVQADIVDLSYLTALEKFAALNIYSSPSFETNTNLTSLWLTCNNWSPSHLQTITKLKKLQHISINHNAAEQCNLFAGLDHIRRLALNSNSFDDEAAASLLCITNLTNLEGLELECSVSDFGYLSQLYQLKNLKIRSAPGDIKNLEYISTLTALTQLDLLLWADTKFSADIVSNLTNLIIFRSVMPADAMDELKYLTNLEHLQVPPFIQHYDFLSHLTKLTCLSADYRSRQPNDTNESFWRNLVQLTNMQEMYIAIDNDARINELTAFKKLTTLSINAAPREFTGIHFTALQSLQTLVFRGEKSQLMYQDFNELLQRMPNLYYYHAY